MIIISKVQDTARASAELAAYILAGCYEPVSFGLSVIKANGDACERMRSA